MEFDIVDYYFDKILIYSIENNTYEFIKKIEKEIREELKKIIDSNNDYVFTESLLNYLTLDKNIIDNLSCFYKEDIYKIKPLCDYYRDINTEYKVKMISPDITLDRFVTTQDEITKEYTLKAYNCVNNIFNIKGIINHRSLTFKKIIFIILSYCHIKNSFDDFIELCNLFMNNPDKILDDLYINSVNDEDEVFINRILIELNSNYKKKIV